MELEDYFDFLAPSAIRLRGTDIAVETVLWPYLDEVLTADQIADRYPMLTREQVFAVLTYYWRNQAAMEDYLAAAEQARPGSRPATPPPAPALLRLRARAERLSIRAATSDSLLTEEPPAPPVRLPD